MGPPSTRTTDWRPRVTDLQRAEAWLEMESCHASTARKRDAKAILAELSRLRAIEQAAREAFRSAHIRDGYLKVHAKDVRAVNAALEAS